MARKKLTSEKKPKDVSSVLKKTVAQKENKRGQEDDASSQQRMKIYVLAVQGASIRKIVEFLDTLNT